MNRAAWIGLVLCVGCSPEPEAVGQPATCLSPSVAPPADHPRAEALQHAIDAAVQDGIPGVVVAISDPDGTWEGSAGMADLGRQTPMRTCHRTRIASVTKTFIAVAVLQLVDEGVVSLDDTVADWLPEVADALPNARQVTVRQLLDHTSGVYNFLDVQFVLDLFNRPTRTWTVQEGIDRALGKDASFAPGTDWSYSNTNYLLLGRILEAAAGQPHATVLRDRLLDPLDLTDTTYAEDRFRFDGVVHGYFDLMGDHVLVDSTDTYANSVVGADGGMVSSARDLLVFGTALFAEGTLLSEALVAELQPTVETGYDDFPHYGLGVELWDEGGIQAVGHGGHEFGYRTWLYHFEESDLTFVLWMNASSLQPTEDNIGAVVERHRRRVRDAALGLGATE